MSGKPIFKLTRKAEVEPLPRVCVAGVGTAGIRVLDQVAGDAVAGATLCVMHTNRAVLAASRVQTRIGLGDGSVERGCGGSVAQGRKAAERDVELIRGMISDSQVLILVAGLGGGTATGALPVILQAARGAGVFTAVMLTLPFGFEGSARQRLAADGLQAVLPIADFTAVVSFDALVGAQGQDVGMERAYQMGLEGLAAGVCSLWQVLAMPSLLALDQGDLLALGSQSGSACQFVYGLGHGSDRAQAAVWSLREGYPDAFGQLAGGGGALACICGSPELRLAEISELVDPLHATVPEAGLFRIGVVLSEQWQDRVFVALFLGDSRKKVKSTVRPKSSSGKDKGKSTTGVRAAQEELKLDTGPSATGQGRFGRTKATILDGEDLDIPTYVRRSIKLAELI